MKLLSLVLFASFVSAQTTQYPGAIDNDSSLFVVADNVQTSLNTSMQTGDTAAVVANAAGFLPNMIATICDTTTNTGKCTAWEHMLITSVSGNILTVIRGFAGTTARTHASGRLVNVLIDSAHQKVLKDAVVAVQTALGPNLSNVAVGSGAVLATGYTFTPYSCNSSSSCAAAGPSGMSLIAGNNTLTMTPVPKGVNGTDTGHALYVSGGVGAAGVCTISGGSGLSGQASGQIIVNCAGTHSGAWTIQSASGGIQEAICGLPATGGLVTASANAALTANVTDCSKSYVTVERLPGATISGSFTVLGAPPANAPTHNEFFHDTPVWASLAAIYDGERHVIGNYPIAEEINQGQFGETQAVVGAVSVPAGSTTQNNFGVAGYGKTQSSTGAAVGIFGQGTGAANSVGAWGANFACNNYVGASGPGFATNCWGIEVDLNGSGTGVAPVDLWGIAVVSAAYQSPTTEFSGVKLQRGNTSQAQFKRGFDSYDGASIIALYAGAATETGANTNSQNITFAMRDASGAGHVAREYLNYSNYLTTIAGSYAWENEVGTVFLTLDTNGLSLGTVSPYFKLGTATYAALGTPANGTVVYCSDCNATCTAGASTGRTCFRENGAWTH